MPFDRYNRDISYLRISLTDACNLRCVYCMPEKMTFLPREDLLSDAELHRLIGLFAAVGFRKIRFTGGEPTLRPALVDLVARAARTPGIETIGLTTNGVLLAELAAPLRAAGLRVWMDELEMSHDLAASMSEGIAKSEGAWRSARSILCQSGPPLADGPTDPSHKCCAGLGCQQMRRNWAAVLGRFSSD